jgi:hypothetical protein
MRNFTIELRHTLTPDVLHKVLNAFAQSFHDVFLFGLPFALAAFIVSLFLKEKPLHGPAKAEAGAEGFEPSHDV